MKTPATTKQKLDHLLRRMDDVRGIGALPGDTSFPRGEELDTLIGVAGELVDELEKTQRKLLETNIQLLSLREVANSMMAVVDMEKTIETLTSYIQNVFGFSQVFLCVVDKKSASLRGKCSRKTPDGTQLLDIVMPISPENGVASKAVLKTRGFLILDPEASPLFVGGAGVDLHPAGSTPESYAVVPLVGGRATKKCFELKSCAREVCPAYGVSERDCWLIDDVRCTHEPGFSAVPRHETCVKCSVFPVLGVLGVVSTGDDPRLSQGGLGLIESLAEGIGTVVENTRLYQDLKEGEKFSQNILDSMAGGLMAVDREGRILTFNKTAEKLTSYHQEELEGRKFTELFRQGEPGEKLVFETLRSGRDFLRKETSIKTKDQTAVPVSLTTSPLRDENDAVYGAIASFTDLTQVKRMEERIRQLDRLAALGRFASSVAHEVRNPLAGITAGVQYISRALPDTQGNREHLEFVLSEITRLDRIVRDLFDVTHPRALALRETDPARTIDRSIQAVLPFIEKAGLTLEKQVDAGMGNVMMDGDQIQQVLMNLIKNAAEASTEGGTITVTASSNRERFPRAASREGELLVLVVEDTGKGIPAEDLKKIFEPFYTTKTTGTGLGLYISHEIVERHGGRLTASSEQGKGTTFLVEIPLDLAEGAASVESNYSRSR